MKEIDCVQVLVKAKNSNYISDFDIHRLKKVILAYEKTIIPDSESIEEIYFNYKGKPKAWG